MREPGTIIYLNGSSSAGKSTLARALQEAFDDPFLNVGIDTLFHALTHGFRRMYRHDSPALEGWRGIALMLDEESNIRSVEFDDWGRRMVFGLHAMVAALAQAGNNVVVDDVIFEPDMLANAARTLAPLGAYLVGVHCPLQVLEERERSRGDRVLGLARYLHRRPHEHVTSYDLEVDTHAATTAECAAVIRDHVQAGRAPSAFQTIAASFDPPPLHKA